MSGGWIAAAETGLGIELPNITRSHTQTELRLATAREAVSKSLSAAGLIQSEQSPQVVAFGSMARYEMNEGSDFDYLVVLNGMVSHPSEIRDYRRAALEAFDELGLDPPGASGLFGTAVSGADFVNTIGLDADTNLHMSRRVLLLQESIALTDENRHTRLIDAVITRYLFEAELSSTAVPRFLLNDVIRLWRTVAVDYEAKRWDDLSGRKAGLRYVKLLSTRKLTYVSSVIALLWPQLLSDDRKMVEKLSEQFRTPALQRFCQLKDVLHDDDLAGLAAALEAADWFLELLADSERRQLLAQASDPNNSLQAAVLRDAKSQSEDLNEALNALLFSSHKTKITDISLGELTKQYLVY